MTPTFNDTTLTVMVREGITPVKLEVDHSLEDELPEFSIPANDVNLNEAIDENVLNQLPGPIKSALTTASVTFSEETWTINFGNGLLSALQQLAGTNGVDLKFYLKVIDENDSEYGSMFNSGYLTVTVE